MILIFDNLYDLNKLKMREEEYLKNVKINKINFLRF
jgi:hypothetical protein